jgi:hypothetical protein
MAHATNYRGPATHTGKSSSGGDRSRLLSYLAQQLMRVAHQHHVAMVVTNHVTTRLSRRDVSSNNTTTTNSTLAPALGEAWGHAATSRVVLFWEGVVRWAYLYKSPYLPQAGAPYYVTPEGVRGHAHRERRRHKRRDPGADPDPSQGEIGRGKRGRGDGTDRAGGV